MTAGQFRQQLKDLMQQQQQLQQVLEGGPPWDGVPGAPPPPLGCLPPPPMPAASVIYCWLLLLLVERKQGLPGLHSGDVAGGVLSTKGDACIASPARAKRMRVCRPQQTLAAAQPGGEEQQHTSNMLSRTHLHRCVGGRGVAAVALERWEGLQGRAVQGCCFEKCGREQCEREESMVASKEDEGEMKQPGVRDVAGRVGEERTPIRPAASQSPSWLAGPFELAGHPLAAAQACGYASIT